MSPAPLLVFDFDGVLCDGMPEYWWAARRAALELEPGLDLPEQAPPAFALLRPLIHKGWEMVLMAAELARPGFDPAAALVDYPRSLREAQERYGGCRPSWWSATACAARCSGAEACSG